MKEGILIFDEVKVIAKVLWNSKSQEMYGLAMTAKDMCSLQDVFETPTVDGQQRSEYVLQCIWRDMTGRFDIIGAYYSAPQSLNARFTAVCVRDALRLFHAYKFKCCALVFDGASTNLTMVKTMMGIKGPFPATSEVRFLTQIHLWELATTRSENEPILLSLGEGMTSTIDRDRSSVQILVIS